MSDQGLPYLNETDAVVVFRGDGTSITNIEAFATGESGAAGQLAKQLADQLRKQIFPARWEAVHEEFEVEEVAEAEAEAEA